MQLGITHSATYLEYPKFCAEVFICPHDRRHDHYSLQLLSVALARSLCIRLSFSPYHFSHERFLSQPLSLSFFLFVSSSFPFCRSLHSLLSSTLSPFSAASSPLFATNTVYYPLLAIESKEPCRTSGLVRARHRRNCARV